LGNNEAGGYSTVSEEMECLTRVVLFLVGFAARVTAVNGTEPLKCPREHSKVFHPDFAAAPSDAAVIFARRNLPRMPATGIMGLGDQESSGGYLLFGIGRRKDERARIS